MRSRFLLILTVCALAGAIPMSAQGHDVRESSSASAAMAAYFADGTSNGLLGMSAMADPHPLTGKGKNVEIVANLPLKGSVAASDLELHGDHAYIGSYGEGMVIVDISNPREPKRVGAFDCPGGQNDVQLSPDASYGVMAVETTANGCHPDDEGVVVLDLRDKANPKEIAWIGQDKLVDGAHNVTLDWPHLYVDQYTQTYARFEIYDLKNPATPELIGTLPAPEGGAHDLQVDHRPDGKVLAYAASIAFTHVLDVTDPTKPAFINRLPASEHGVGISHGIEPNHDRTLLIETDEYGGGSGVGACGSRADAVQLPTDGQVASASPGAFHLLRMNEDGTIKTLPGGKTDQVGAYNTPVQTTGNTNDGCTSHVFWQAPDENRMTIAWYQRGTRIVDFADPANPVEIGFFEATGGEAWSAKPHKGYIFVGDTKRGLDVLRYTGEDCKRWPTTAGAAEVQRARYQNAEPPAGAPAKWPEGCGAAATNEPPAPMQGTPGSATNPGTTGGQPQQQPPPQSQPQGGGSKEVGGYRFMRVVKVKKAGKAKRKTIRLQVLDASGKVVASRKYRIPVGKRVRVRAAIGGPVGRYGYRIRAGKKTLKRGSFSIKTVSRIRVNGAAADKVKVGRLNR